MGRRHRPWRAGALVALCVATISTGARGAGYSTAGYATDHGSPAIPNTFAVYYNTGVPGSTDGVQRWHNISGQLLALYNTFAGAYWIERARLGVGVSVSPVFHSVATVRARNSDGSDDALANGTLVEGRSYLKATGM